MARRLDSENEIKDYTKENLASLEGSPIVMSTAKGFDQNKWNIPETEFICPSIKLINNLDTNSYNLKRTDSEAVKPGGTASSSRQLRLMSVSDDKCCIRLSFNERVLIPTLPRTRD